MAESLKEKAIKDYLAKINFKNDDWKISEIQEEMRKFLGEAPGIDISYSKDVLIKEGSEEAVEEYKIQKITIVFYDLNEHYKKLEILV